jgi:hypothetical protein
VLHIRCENCTRESTKKVDVPAADDAPIDPEDLIDCAFLQSIAYQCRPCGGVIGRLFRIEMD